MGSLSSPAPPRPWSLAPWAILFVLVLLLGACQRIFPYGALPPSDGTTEGRVDGALSDGSTDAGRDQLPADLPVPDLLLATDKGCPKGTTQCGSYCVDLRSDVHHCGKCDKRCGAGLNCKNGTCRCVESGLCSGCCAGNVCLPLGNAQSPRVCGKGGKSCEDCSDGNVCTIERCSVGVCKHEPVKTVVKCKKNHTDGQCVAGRCCTGCQAGGGCYPFGGTQNAGRCGHEGESCKSCQPGGTCKVAGCSGGRCTSSNKPANNACTAGGHNGLCLGGACCTGCRKNGTCYPLSGSVKDASQCGRGGVTCKKCSGRGVCYTGKCDQGKCVSVKKPDGTQCNDKGQSGRCARGVCCTTGCRSGGSCRSSSLHHCGAQGNLCTDCHQTSDPCKTGGTCANGLCQYVASSMGTPCGKGAGHCVLGSCCTTCIEKDASGTNGTCRVQTDAQHCGKDGGYCHACTAGKICKSGVCTWSGMCGTMTCPQGCCKNNTCIPLSSQSSTQCGKGGATCVVCPASQSCQTGSPWFGACG